MSQAKINRQVLNRNAKESARIVRVTLEKLGELGPSEAAKILDLDPGTVSKWIKRGRISESRAREILFKLL